MLCLREVGSSNLPKSIRDSAFDCLRFGLVFQWQKIRFAFLTLFEHILTKGIDCDLQNFIPMHAGQVMGLGDAVAVEPHHMPKQNNIPAAAATAIESGKKGLPPANI